MKRFWILALAALSLPAAVSPQLKQVNTVYILAMTSGMDQFLANSLTNLGVFQVVTDPQKADAILTDRLGEPFEGKLNELFPPPRAPKEEHEGQDDAKDGAGKKAGVGDLGGSAVRVTSSAGRGKGNIFLVDRKSRAVLWSVYEPPKDSTPGELSKTAVRVVKRLKSDLADKKQAVEQ